jgi:hypothetical protein
MPTEVLANNASTTLNANVTTTPAAGTSEVWTVASTALFPQIGTGGTQQFRLTTGPSSDTDPELCICTQINSTTTITVLRGAEGSPIKTHAIGDPVIGTLTVGGLLNYIATIRPGPTVFTSSGTYTIPPGASLLKISAVGGGGGGGGGAYSQGGGGGASGVFTEEVVAVGANTSLAVTIGAAGTGGYQSESTNYAGSQGGTTTVSGTGISVSASGGGGGSGSAGGSTYTFTAGGAPGIQYPVSFSGANPTTQATGNWNFPPTAPGVGGFGVSSPLAMAAGGAPLGRAGGAGAGGGGVSGGGGSGSGGQPGGAGTATQGGAPPPALGGATYHGGIDGTSAGAVTTYGAGAGAGGGGGGAGTYAGTVTIGVQPFTGATGTSVGTLTTSSTWTNSTPSQGALMIAVVYSSATSSTLITAPAGWTALYRSSPNATSGCIGVFTKPAAASENVGYTFTMPSGAHVSALIMGFNGMGAIDGSVVNTEQDAATTAWSVPAMTPTHDPNESVLTVLCSSGGSVVTAAPTGYTLTTAFNTSVAYQNLSSISAVSSASGGTLSSQSFQQITLLIRSGSNGGNGAPGAAFIEVLA